MAIQSVFDMVVKVFLALPGWMLAIFAVIFIAPAFYFSTRQRYPAAPTLKLSVRPGSLGTLDDTLLFVADSPRLFQLGYEKYSKKGINYLLNTPQGKEYVMAPNFVEEIRRAPDTHVSNLAANNEIMQLGHTLHPLLMKEQYHFDTPIRKSLTQSLGPKLPDIVEEAKLSLDQHVGRTTDWKEFQMGSLAFGVVTRTANRLLFGPILARNDEFLKLSITYTITMFGGASLIRNWPSILKPAVMWWKTNIYQEQAIARKHLIPLLKQRIADEDRYISEGRLDEWKKIKAEDTIQWVLDVTPPEERNPSRLVYRMLHINVAAVHTSSVTFLDNAYCLAMQPQLHGELRQEVEEVFQKEGGWTKQGLSRLNKLDSFMKEVARFCCSSASKLKRQTIRDWELSDGTVIPRGITLCVNDLPVVLDSENFEKPLEFDAFRAYRQRQTTGQEAQHQFVMTSPHHLAFGHGKHACPGRFFASNEIKTLLVMMLMRYDLKMSIEGGMETIRKGVWYNDQRSPNPTGVVQLKARESTPGHLLNYFCKVFGYKLSTITSAKFHPPIRPGFARYFTNIETAGKSGLRPDLTTPTAQIKPSSPRNETSSRKLGKNACSKWVKHPNSRLWRFRKTLSSKTSPRGVMAQVNGTTQINGHKDGEPTDQHMEDNMNVQSSGTHDIPPAELHENPNYIKKITIPLNDTTAWKPRRKLRVVTIGAGYSGMIFAQKLQHKYSKEMDEILEHVIYEARDDVGGTWSANTYPGVMCDVPSTIYAFPFDPNAEWSHFYSRGHEILTYFRDRVKKWNLQKNVQFGNRVSGAFWQEDKSQWRLLIQKDGKEREEYADVLISAKGFLSTWQWPKIPGLESFKGHRVHSAGWDHSYDYRNKKIAVIGNGSSGIQILPEMAKLDGTQVTSFQRGPTWVVSRHQPAKLVGSDDSSFNPEYKESDKEKFRDPAELKKYRKLVQGNINKAFGVFLKGSQANKDMEVFAREQMSKKLNYDPVLCEKLIPKWELGCRRITPGEGYLESFTRDNVRLCDSGITSVSEKGVHTEDGTLHELDVIICATGFDISQVPTFPIIGRDNVSLAEKWASEPESYISLACPSMPNYFIFTGPNATVGHGSLLESLGWSAEWMIQWLRKMAQEDIASVCPKQDVVDEFVRYGDQIHKTLTWTGGCRSWYKANRVNGRVTATFAGSAILYNKLVERIRPEDFEIRYRSANRWRFLGNGFTEYEMVEGNDLSYYVTN